MPRVSVLMTTYNAGSFLKPAVQSVLDQTLEDLELLVVDDGSTDGSVDDLRSLDDPRLRIERQPRRGLGVPVNDWLTQLSGTYIMRMDADDLALPDRAERQSRFLDEHPEVVLVGCQYRFFSEHGLGPRSHLPSDNEAIVDGLHRGWHTISHATTMYRRELIDQGLRYTWSGPGEDWSFFGDAAQLGRLAVLDEVLYHYRIHGASSAWVGSTESVLGLEYAIARQGSRERGVALPTQDEFLASHQMSVRSRAAAFSRSTSAVWFRRSIMASTSGQRWRGSALKASAAALDPRKTVGFASKRWAKVRGRNV